MLTSSIRVGRDEAGHVVSWDLQTGGVVSVVKWKQPPGNVRSYIAYSANGEMVAVLSRYKPSTISMSIYNVVSGTHIYDVDHDTQTSLDLNLTVVCLDDIWTDGESLQFATYGPTGFTIWEVGFASGTSPKEVKTLPIPDDALKSPVFNPERGDDDALIEFHPASCRFVRYGPENALLIWDARASKVLLDHIAVDNVNSITFSSDGRFFAYGTYESGVYLWKDSSTGYTLFEILSTAPWSRPLLSPNGESMITYVGSRMQLWHTKTFPTTTSIIPANAIQNDVSNLILEFFPDRPLAVATRKKGKTVTVLDLKSGLSRLIIDTSVEVYGLGAIGDTIVVIGKEKAITWDLPGGGFLPDARVNIEESTQTIHFPNEDCNDRVIYAASISPNSRYIATGGYTQQGDFLDIYSTSTGGCKIREEIFTRGLCFAPGGQDIWCLAGGEVKEFKITEDTLVHTKTVDIDDGSLGHYWRSLHGNRVTEDWWILDAGGERLLMLPPVWQSKYEEDRVWNGKFLALLHSELPEPVILELQP
jgi:WD40 repeat protein